MKRFLSLAAGVLFSATLLAQAIDTTVTAPVIDRILREPQYGYMEYYSYQPPTAPTARPPKGYKPFYVSHYGRHGARFNYLQDSYDNLKVFFEKAAAEGKLTPRGETLCRRYLDAYPYFYKRAGDLTGKGWAQHYGIGERMAKNYKAIFRKNPHIDARSSMIQRSILSMVACCDALEDNLCGIDITKSASESYMWFMNPLHSTLPFVTEGLTKVNAYDDAWRREASALRKKVIHENEWLAPYFNDLDWVESAFGKYKLYMELFYLAASTQCTDLDISFEDLFTPEEICGIWEMRNISVYNRMGPGQNGSNHIYDISCLLLKDILDKAEEDIASGAYGARLRFGHDTTIALLMALMGADGWNKAVSHPWEVKYVYDYTAIQMAVNIQLVFYRNSKDDILVRMMLNERDITLPLPAENAPYYRWSDFLSHYRQVSSDALSRMTAAVEALH